MSDPITHPKPAVILAPIAPTEIEQLAVKNLKIGLNETRLAEIEQDAAAVRASRVEHVEDPAIAVGVAKELQRIRQLSQI
jgi:hypothetical protein